MQSNFISSNNLLISILAVILFSASMSDLKTYKIPNILTLTASFFAIAYHTVFNGPSGFVFSFSGFVCGIALLLVPYMMGGMGAGDVKLMGAVGSFLGAKAAFEAFIFIALIGGIYSLAMIIFRQDAFRGFFSEKLIRLPGIVTLKQFAPIQNPIEKSSQKPRLKYGVAIAFGTIGYLLAKSFGFGFLT